MRKNLQTKSREFNVDSFVHEKPKHPAVDAVDEAIDEIKGCERKLQEAQLKLRQRVVELDQISERSDRLRAVRWFYWQEEQTRPTDMCEALFGRGASTVHFQDQMRKLVGPFGTTKQLDKQYFGELQLDSD